MQGLGGPASSSQRLPAAAGERASARQPAVGGNPPPGISGQTSFIISEVHQPDLPEGDDQPERRRLDQHLRWPGYDNASGTGGVFASCSAQQLDVTNAEHARCHPGERYLQELLLCLEKSSSVDDAAVACQAPAANVLHGGAIFANDQDRTSADPYGSRIRHRRAGEFSAATQHVHPADPVAGACNATSAAGRPERPGSPTGVGFDRSKVAASRGRRWPRPRRRGRDARSVHARAGGHGAADLAPLGPASAVGAAMNPRRASGSMRYGAVRAFVLVR
jgi:hypothetical protein